MENAATKTQKKEILEVRNLVKHFEVEGSQDVVRAVDGISFDIFAGETLGLVRRIGLREINCRTLHFASARTDIGRSDF